MKKSERKRFIKEFVQRNVYKQIGAEYMDDIDVLYVRPYSVDNDCKNPYCGLEGIVQYPNTRKYEFVIKFNIVEDVHKPTLTVAVLKLESK